MPFFDYVNENDPLDVWEDAFFGLFEDAPETLKNENGQIYRFKISYPSADFILKGGDFTSNSKIKYMSKDEMKKNIKRDDQIKKYKEKVSKLFNK